MGWGEIGYVAKSEPKEVKVIPQHKPSMSTREIV